MDKIISSGPPGGPPATPLVCTMAGSTPPSDGQCPGTGGSPRPSGPAWGGGQRAAPGSNGSLGQASLASLLLLWEQGHSEAGGHHYTGGTWPISAEESKGGVRPLSRRPGSCTSWGDRRGRPPLSGTSSASTCMDVQTSERQSPPSPDHQPGSHLAPVLPLDGGEQVDEHQGRHGHRDQELAAKHSAENKIKINENVRGMEMSNEDIKIKIRKEAEKPENSTNVTCV